MSDSGEVHLFESETLLMEAFSFEGYGNAKIEMYSSITGKGLVVDLETPEEFNDIVIPWEKIPELIDFLKRRIGTD